MTDRCYAVNPLIEDLYTLRNAADTLIRKLSNYRTFVALNIEEGNRRMIWATMLTPTQVIEFWESIADIEAYWHDPSLFPGEVHEMPGLGSYPLDYDLYAHVHTNTDSHLSFLEDMYYHVGYVDVPDCRGMPTPETFRQLVLDSHELISPWERMTKEARANVEKMFREFGETK